MVCYLFLLPHGEWVFGFWFLLADNSRIRLVRAGFKLSFDVTCFDSL
jgi:hypothetical protein